MNMRGKTWHCEKPLKLQQMSLKVRTVKQTFFLFPALIRQDAHPTPIQVLFFKLVTGHEHNRRSTSTYRTRLCSVDRIPTAELLLITVNL
ncbi:MAG: hypothetical protein F6K55_22315 [Moorea sp. SIO4A3]|nr:hypothetical protein [Moorena sp. SIO4A3]